MFTHQPDRNGGQDGTGTGDHDQPFKGFRAYQFNTRELARMLQLRSELLDAKLGRGRWSDDWLPDPRLSSVKRLFTRNVYPM